MSEIAVNDLVQVSVLTGDDSAAVASDAVASQRALVKELRAGKLVLTAVDEPGCLKSTLTVGSRILLHTPDSTGVNVYKAIVTAALTQVPPAYVVRTLTPAERIDRRAAVRVPMNDIEVRLTQTDGRIWLPAKLRDLSETGACLMTTDKFDIGERLMLELEFSPQTVPKAVVRRCCTEKGEAANVVGIEFLDNRGSLREQIKSIVTRRQWELEKQSQADAQASAGRA